jgi:hypothetical protein
LIHYKNLTVRDTVIAGYAAQMCIPAMLRTIRRIAPGSPPSAQISTEPHVIVNPDIPRIPRWDVRTRRMIPRMEFTISVVRFLRKYHRTIRIKAAATRVSKVPNITVILTAVWIKFFEKRLYEAYLPITLNSENLR